MVPIRFTGSRMPQTWSRWRTAPHVLVVRKDLPVKTIPEFIALAKDKEWNCGSTGVGSASHLTLELFKTRTGVKMIHVPFRGSAPLATELLAGRIDASFATLPTIAAQVDAGDIKALAIASNTQTRGCRACRRSPRPVVTGVEPMRGSRCSHPAGTPQAACERIAPRGGEGVRERGSREKCWRRWA